MQVSVRELKNHLSEYLKRASNGEDVTVTSHGRPIARLASAQITSAGGENDAIEWLSALPWVIQAKSGGSFPLFQPVATTGSNEELMSDIVLGMRE